MEYLFMAVMLLLAITGILQKMLLLLGLLAVPIAGPTTTSIAYGFFMPLALVALYAKIFHGKMPLLAIVLLLVAYIAHKFIKDSKMHYMEKVLVEGSFIGMIIFGVVYFFKANPPFFYA